MRCNKNTSGIYPAGKLPREDLVELLKGQVIDDPRVILGPGLGRDAAVIDFGERYLVTKSDPITFATDEIGWYVVHVNANDIACLGASPLWFIATLLLPEGKTDKRLVQSIFEQLQSGCSEVGATLVGGHTEITVGLDRPIAIGTMFGEVSPAQLIRSDGARPGDKLLLTKQIAVEGTALLAREARDALQSTLPEALLERAARFLHEPGISVVRDAATLIRAGRVHAMHDPTEGGIATGLREITEAAGVGALIEADALPVYPETRALCAALQLDPLGLIASGSLLAAVAAEDADEMVRALQAANIPAKLIGTVRETPGVALHDDTGQHPLPIFARDEIARFFEDREDHA